MIYDINATNINKLFVFLTDFMTLNIIRKTVIFQY